MKACFDKKCKINTTGKPLAAIKSVDPTTFLPCKRVLHQQIKRVWYVAYLYKTASDPYPAIDAALIYYGFQLTPDKEYICINWFKGEQMPQEIEDIESNIESEDDDEDDDSDCDVDDDDDDACDDACILENEDGDPIDTDSESDGDLL